MTAFISRDLSATSEFRRLLGERGWQVSGQSLVVLSPLPFPDVPAADWIFFSSQHAVRFFFENLEQEGLARPPARWAALGEATARLLSDYVDDVAFRGSGDPVEAAAAFCRLALGSMVLFPGARHSQQSVQRQLGTAIRSRHLEVYDNCPVADPEPRTEAVLVFTSPLNAEAYLARHGLRADQRLVAIGATTAGAIRVLGWPVAATAAAPTEVALAEAILAFGN